MIVAAHRCPTCGSVPNPTWTPDTIVAAAKAWAERTGKQPALWQWQKASPLNPSKTTVVDMFGSWNGMIAAAGFVPRSRGGVGEFTREQALHALLVFKYEHGRLPGSREWAAPGRGRPTRSQAERLFGSWGAFIVAGGYRPSPSYRTGEGYQRQAGMRQRILTNNGITTAATGTSLRDAGAGGGRRDIMTDTQYAIGDAIEDAVASFRMALLGQGHLQIGVHHVSRGSFDLLPGDEQHFSATDDVREFWTKRGFEWSNEDMRHHVAVSYFTNEAPVVVPILAGGAS